MADCTLVRYLQSFSSLTIGRVTIIQSCRNASFAVCQSSSTRQNGYTVRSAPPAVCHPEWLFEVKWDGFRALVQIDRGVCRLISRNGNQFKSFPALAEILPAELRDRSAILDGEIVCLDRLGKTQFKDLLFRRGEPRCYAFDLLWADDRYNCGHPKTGAN
jgi:ATP-dependent DNA ligase